MLLAPASVRGGARSSGLAEQLLQVLEATSDGVMLVNRSWKPTYLNPVATRILAPSGDVLGKNFWKSFPHTVFDDSPYLAAYYRAMDGREECDFQAYYPEPQNAWFHIRVQPWQDGIAIYFREIPERKDAQLAGEGEQQYAVDLNPQIVWNADGEGRVLALSSRWRAVTGLTVAQSLGDGWAHATHPEDRERTEEAWAGALKNGEPYDVEHRLRTASGEFCWVRTRAFPQLDKEGAVVAWYGTTEDIHERKKAQQALLQSEKLAAVGKLAASIAHEINNPLASVTNLLYLAQQSTDMREVRDYVDTAERELRRASAITHQALRFHKQTTGSRAVTCQELIGSALSVYQGRLLNSSIEVEKRKRAGCPITCFEGEIRQVLSNLIGNAIDAMHPGGGRLILRSREATDSMTGRRGIVLTVADTGTGMSPETAAQSFEAFFTTKGIGGTGLGLWTSREIVGRHHGRIAVRSSQREGHRGTVATVFLPFDATSR